MKQIHRLGQQNIVKTLKSFPCLYLAGPRQSGKTTLVQHIAESEHKADYITFDNIQACLSAKNNPEEFLRSFSGSVILDEIQMVPELFRPLKIIIDENRKRQDGGRGKFLLTGSASILALPALSDALVGRMALKTLLPLSTLESSQGSKTTFIDLAFDDNWDIRQSANIDLADLMQGASFPELADLDSSIYGQWCDGYINTIIQRDVRTLMEIEKLGALPNMLKLLASRTSGILNEASINRSLQINHITAKKYRLLLDGLFLTLSIPAWSANLGKRLIKAPKIYICDINILMYLLNMNLADVMQNNKTFFGQILENFIATELTKQLTFSDINAKLFHYRTSGGQEVDFLLEGPASKIVGIEVKAKEVVDIKDFIHLKSLQEDLGDRFVRGFVFYQGKHILPFGKNLWAIPVSGISLGEL